MQQPTRVYLDNAATTRLRAAAETAMQPYLHEVYGNASSPYAVSRSARMAIDRARASVAAVIGAHPDEIVFTSGGTESDNWALLGTGLKALAESARGHVLVSAIEHPAVDEAAATLAELGFEVEHIPVDEHGVVLPAALVDRLRPTTLLVSVMTVNNEVGTVQPVGELAKVIKEKSSALFHTDAVQAAGKIDIGFLANTVDMISLSGHKFGGPKGAGALFVKRGVKLQSLLRGGGQERGRRAGTENVPAIVGMGTAAELALAELEENGKALQGLRERLESGLAKLGDVTINGAGAERAPHITSVRMTGLRAESLALALDLRGFAVGTGSACASGALEPSHVLAAMGQSKDEARSALRVSLGTQNSAVEIDEFLQVLGELEQSGRV